MSSITHRRPRRAALALLVSSLGALLGASSPLSALPAFPGAEGFGANATGGRGGTVYRVTNLNDSGSGSFRDAVSQPNRTVVFEVGGIVTLTSPVSVKANITIAGQTAPGQGIALYGDRLSFTDANNTIVRYLRVREGINGDSGTDAFGAASGSTMIFDHVSVAWGRDETFSLSGALSNITIQDSIIGQGLLIHSAGSLLETSGGISVFRSLYIDNYMRNPKIKGVNDFRNNVVYNWGSGGGYIPAGNSAGLSYANMIGNAFIAGPTTPSGGAFKNGNANYSLYHANNIEDLNVDGVLDNTPVTNASFPTLTLVGTPFNYPAPATALSPQQAYAHVLVHAGASLYRDNADATMINELASLGTLGGHIFNESEVGGIGTLTGALAPKDTDLDGIPDYWEEAAGTNPLVADNNGDINGDGYTNLENYLNALATAGVPAATISGIVSDSGSSSADGVTSDNTLVLRGTAAPGLVVTIARVDTGVLGTATADVFGQWEYDYSATALADRYYAFTATAELPGGQISPPTRAFVVKVDTVAAAAPTITALVSNPAIVINGTAEPGARVDVTLVGTGVVGNATADPLGNWSATYSGPALPAGTHTFTATATDVAGNSGAASANYTVDTSLVAPVLTGIATDTGISATDRITNDQTLVLNGTSFANATISVTRTGVGVIGSATANASGAWSFSYTGTTLAAGVHTFTATASNGGSSSPVSDALTVTIDRTTPAISSIRRQSPTTAATTASTLVYRVTFAEPVLNVDAADFSLTQSGATGTIASLAAVSSTVYDVTVTGASGDGTLRLDLRSSGTGIVDIAGNAIPNTAYTAGQTYTIRLPGSGVWIATESGEAWSVAANWEDGIVASGSGATADFSARNLDDEVVVQLDGPRTLGRVVFGDTDFTAPALWRLTDSGNSANVLTLAGTSPNLQVNATTTASGDVADVPAAAAYPSTLDVVLAGTAGFTKTGVGTLDIVKPATITGPLTITKGIVRVGTGGSLTASTVTLATSQQLHVTGGTFNATGSVTWTSGTGTGIVVSAGTGTFQRILPSNFRNSFVRVTGGTLNATEITFPRSGDSEGQAVAAGILMSGGVANVGTIGLGTGDSWGAMTISGGQMNVTGQLNVGWQRTSARGGVVNVSGGELNVFDEAILARNPGGSNNNTNNVAKLTLTGGVTNIAKLTLGFDATSSAGSATVTLTNAQLNLGAGGLVKNGTSGMTTALNLNSGALGAFANWATTHPLTLNGTTATLTVRAGTSNGTPFDIALGGVLGGAGGFTKTGDGTLTLTAANTFTGGVAVADGTLRLDGSLVAASAVAVDAGATLAGSGAANGAVTLGAASTLAPGGAPGAIATLTTGALNWQGGARLSVDLGASGVADRLAVTGALTKGVAGTYEVALNATAGWTPGATYTVASFASTDFVAADFTATGVPSGYAAAFAINGGNLDVTIVGTPAISGPTSAGGVFGSTLSVAITATNVPTSYAATGLPPGLTLDTLTGAISGTPTAAGAFTATVSATNLAGTGSGTLAFTIAKAPATVVPGSLSQTYTGSPRIASATTSPAGLNVTFTYDGSSTAPTSAGSYAVVGTIADANYAGTASDTLTVAKATQTIAFPNPGPKTFGEPAFTLGATATSDLPVSYSLVSGPVSLSGSTALITGVGSATLRASQAGNGNYLAAADVDVTFTIAQATATITLANLTQPYDGTPRVVTATTSPSGLNVVFTYNGSPTAPTKPGTYAVSATLNEPNYTGSASGTLVVTITALVRSAEMNADIEGSIQILSPVNLTLNSGALVSGDILVPGTPQVRLNGNPTLAGIQNSDGATNPTSHTITLNSNAVARYVVRRVDAIALPTVSAPLSPAGTRNVSLNNAGDPLGNPATIRNLTLNGNVGPIVLPPGAYGDLTANNGRFVFGVAGGTEPVTYHLQRLTINGNSGLEIVGPVIIRLANGTSFNASVGASIAPQWLRLEVLSGGVTLNGNIQLYGDVVAPTGAVTINGNSVLRGHVSADSLRLNGNALLAEPATSTGGGGSGPLP